MKSIKSKILVLTLVTVVIMISLISAITYQQASNSIDVKGLALTESIKLAVENSITSREIAEDILEKEMVGQAVLISNIIDKGTSYEELVELAKRSGIDEFWATDENANTILTNMAPSVDFNFASDPEGQAYEFVQLLDGSESVITQPAQIRTVDDQVFKFVGVKGWSTPQIVQVGRSGEALLSLEESIGQGHAIQTLHTYLNDEILFAGILSAETKEWIHATNTEVESSLKDYAVANIGSSSTVFDNQRIDGVRSNVYVTTLSNGDSLVLGLSSALLSNILTTTIITVVIAIALTSVVIYYVINKLFTRISRVKSSLLEISDGDGDLKKRLEINSEDEIDSLASAFNKMLDKIQALVLSVKELSLTVASSANELKVSIDQSKEATNMTTLSIQDVAAGADTQLRYVEEGTHGIAHITTLIEQISDTTNHVSTNAKDTATIAQKGYTSMEDVVKQINSIHSTVINTAQVIENLDKRSEEIGAIIHVITDISEQTNLLALNAAIEAARAGEQGKGFAVVADEVRKLAEQSKNSASRISELVSEVQYSTKDASSSMNEGVEKVEEGLKVIENVGRLFNEITEGINQSSKQMAELSASTEHIDNNAQGTNKLMIDMSELAKTTTTNTENIAAASEEQLATMDEVANSIAKLNSLSHQLEELVVRYKA